MRSPLPRPTPSLQRGRLLPRGLAGRGCAVALTALVPLALAVQRHGEPIAVDDAADAVRPPLPAMVGAGLDAAARLLPPAMPVVGAALALLCWSRGSRRGAALCLLGPLAASTTTAVLKPLLARPAGSGEGWMFPSGHVTVVAAVAVAAAVLLLPHGVLSSGLGRARALAWSLVVAAPLVTAAGTVLHRYHHLTDVVGAALVAAAVVLAVAAGLDRVPRRCPD